LLVTDGRNVDFVHHNPTPMAMRMTTPQALALRKIHKPKEAHKPDDKPEDKPDGEHKPKAQKPEEELEWGGEDCTCGSATSTDEMRCTCICGDGTWSCQQAGLGVCGVDHCCSVGCPALKVCNPNAPVLDWELMTVRT